MATDAEPPTLPPWSSGLPPGIAAAVLCRLPSRADRLNFAAVCHPWRAVAGHKSRTIPQPLPWLALPDGTFFGFPEPTALLFPHAARYHGSCDDWLLFGGDDGYLLLNPFTGDTMRLPGLSSVRHVVRDGVELEWHGVMDDRRAPIGTTVRKMVMCPAQVVAAIVGDGRLGKIAMCRPNTDSWLISAHDAWRGFRDIAFYDGKVYAVEGGGDLFAMPFDVDGRTGEPKVAWAKRVFKGSHTVPVRYGKAQAMRYLFVSGGRLLMVRRALRSDTMTEFTVFKADFVRLRWSEVSSVGDDTSLFVGRWSSVARRVSRYKLPGNRIYFVDDDAFWHSSCHDHFGAYDIRDGATYPLLPPLELRSCAGDTPATWLFPREKQGAVRWADLPADVLGQVVRLLPSREGRLHLREVCRDWLVSVTQHLRRRPPPPRTPLPTTPPAVAYLALPNGRIFGYPGLMSRFSNTTAAGYLGACGDSLLFDDDNDGLLRLTSPFTGKTRLLPSLLDIRFRDEPIEIVNEPASSRREGTPCPQWSDNEMMAVQKMVACPDSGGGGGGGLITAIVGRELFAKVAVCSLETFSWSLSAHDRWRWYEDLAFCGGRLYAVTAAEDLLAFDVGVDGDTGAPFVARVERVVVGGHGMCSHEAHYLVESRGGAPLMVCAGKSAARLFEVFRADLASSSWTPVSNLGRDEALFVGRLCSRAVSTRGYGHRIFFLPDDCAGMVVRAHGRRRPSDHHAAVYDMWDGRIAYILPREIRTDDGPVPETWLFPETHVDQ